MSGHHIPREQLYEETGMTALQRDRLIMKRHRQGWTQSRIAKELGMTQPAISLAVARLTGKAKPKKKRVDFDDGMECDPIAAPNYEEW